MKASARTAAACLLLLAASVRGARGAGFDADAGASATVGSGGYHRFSLFADGNWTGKTLEPYAWGQYAVDNDLSQLGAGGGAWKQLTPGLSVKAGAGFYVGRLRDTDQTGTSLLLETGLEGYSGGKTLGAELRLTDGTIGGPAQPIRYGEALRAQAGRRRGQAGAPSPLSYTYTELAGYGRLPLGESSLGLRLALGLPSYASEVTSEELSLRLPLSKAWRAMTAVTLEQFAGASNAYFSLGVYRLF
ncbi:MAG: hypothetical protein KGO96_13305 [Elusimicrobia bacterium]|nr:hypothetical protein [Elusimicrobiota bacterium]MDE2426871.1 hypothetical protein [Elusimicrobiota bacterium]